MDLWWVQIFGYVLACRSYSFVCTVHHLIVIIVQTYLKTTYKVPVRFILSSVWVRLSIFFPLSIIQYVGLYVFSLPISLVMNERIYIPCLIIIIKSELWTTTHCLGLGHETIVSTLCVSIFLWIWMITHNSSSVTMISCLTLKQLGHFFQYLILFPNVVQQICNIFIWNWSNKLNV